MPDEPSRNGEAVPDEQILLWEQKVSPERSQRPFRSIVGKAIPEVILEEIPECDRRRRRRQIPANPEFAFANPEFASAGRG